MKTPNKTIKTCLTVVALLVGMTGGQLSGNRTAGATGTVQPGGTNTIVVPPPLVIKIVKQPKDQVVRLGGKAKFEVVAKPLPLNYQWRKNGVAIPGATNSTYTISDVKFSDGGFYSCHLMKNPSADTREAALLVTSTTTTSQGPFIPGGGTRNPCPGVWYGYAIITNYNVNPPTRWWTKPPNATTCTIQEVNRPASPPGYVSSIEAVESGMTGRWCTNSPNSLTFPVRTNKQYQFTIFVNNIPPPPTTNQMLTLQITW
jgi:hypothetical protein